MKLHSDPEIALQQLKEEHDRQKRVLQEIEAEHKRLQTQVALAYRTVDIWAAAERAAVRIDSLYRNKTWVGFLPIKQLTKIIAEENGYE